MGGGGGGAKSFYQVAQRLVLNETPVNNQRASRTVEVEGVNQLMSILSYFDHRQNNL